MPSYTLQLMISAQDLTTLRQAGESIVIARAFSGSSPNVAWVSFAPFSSNTVTWDDAYGLFASPAQSSGTIQILSQTSGTAASGMYYNFADASFSGPFSGASAPGAGSFRVFNQMPSSQYTALGFGMLQSATVNGSALPARPANLDIVPAMQFSTFTPLNTVYVWLQSGVSSGDIVTLPPLSMGAALAVSSRATKVQFSGTSSLSYVYESSVGAFVPAN
ncbi:MAG TPA: hypothetical protein VEL74_20520 [Thermoanaerobaculia bacterium]|nr:hypothetical protein [Thermoanaerobaculia bacterium]